MRFRTPLAWKNLTHDGRRLLIAISGVSFAVILIFMELGFLNALLESTVQLLRRLNGEIVIVSRAQYALVAGERFDIRRMYDARELVGVESVSPVYIDTTAAMLRPPGGRGFPIRVVATPAADPALDIPQFAAQQADLDMIGTALADVTSRRKYGFPTIGPRLKHFQGELNGKKLNLAGQFHLGIDFASDGNLLMTAANFSRFFPHRAAGGDPLRLIDLGVVRLEQNANPAAVLKNLKRVLPGDVDALTKDQIISREKHFWQTNAPLGYIFMVGAIMGFVVGVVICYQIVYADIADHMKEFATLKAIGYGSRYFVGLVLRQCLYLAALGFIPGFAVSYVSYAALSKITGLTMQMTWGLALTVFAATAAMCIISGLLAVSKLLAADPADLF